MNCNSFASFLSPEYNKTMEQEQQIPFRTGEFCLARYSGLLTVKAFKQHRPEDILSFDSVSTDECCNGGHYTRVDTDVGDEQDVKKLSSPVVN
eukprot:CAMPEP_0194029232 /NCGR_PEP_ID=MMETSP0009_2-20130614/3023_1 /TAXON_ID=210454 /ORGANISM="Grammatophora oceanica, Strain CCMP 410" /LENGTH=92 /DNA_ID=CAMNT_0038668843 /DNA_START=33 /DNA_END=311 /DNA_ORIENTATION=-